MMVTNWPDGARLKEGQIQNFNSAFKMYEILYDAYNLSPPEGVKKEVWKRTVIQAFNAQVYFNLPKRFQVLYSRKISVSALKSKDKPTEEHYNPRKLWVKFRLFDIPEKVTFSEFFKLYCREGGRYHKTTSAENSILENWYKENGIEEYQIGMWKRAYSSKGVTLVDDPKHLEAGE